RVSKGHILKPTMGLLSTKEQQRDSNRQVGQCYGRTEGVHQTWAAKRPPKNEPRLQMQSSDVNAGSTTVKGDQQQTSQIEVPTPPEAVEQIGPKENETDRTKGPREPQHSAQDRREEEQSQQQRSSEGEAQLQTKKEATSNVEEESTLVTGENEQTKTVNADQSEKLCEEGRHGAGIDEIKYSKNNSDMRADQQSGPNNKDNISGSPRSAEVPMNENWGGKSRAEAEQHLGTEAHLAHFWDELNEKERNCLIAQFDSIDLRDAKRAFEMSASPKDLQRIQGFDDDHYAVPKNMNEELLNAYWHKGLEAIADGKVGVVVLAGGQATRLGASSPKGTLSLNLEGFSRPDSLLAIQAARIARLQRLASTAFPDSKPVIQWLVMTSKATEKDTVEHLKKIVPECGLDENQLTVFSQNDFPCFNMDGSLILSTKSSIATSPDGNGGLYTALAPYLGRLRARGVQYLHVYCVDNILCRVADPHFLGFCIDKGADCAAKAVEKVEPHEAVGVICLESGKARVVEYSEISKELAEKRDESGRLMLRAGNIANHFFTIDFLEHVCKAENRLHFHRAIKKIPFVGDNGEVVKPEQPNGVKLEQFVFDVFGYSSNFYVWEVRREEEFSPLKNAEIVGKDCMSTCRRDLSRENRRWLECVGATIEGDGFVFIHPSVSYGGEGLGDYNGVHISTPIVLQ
uniref:UDP-N-acetylglucosamine diphosphorylase n=1 Tax=Parascaris univalens TaxID=6257 RepID=A0A915BDJ4_PARUN